ncbi:hypothetical protein LDENG_00155660 [Lucifuga dentata]|nr:hypothetical protein LDENG_00155660 [Lucifuga dentata]
MKPSHLKKAEEEKQPKLKEAPDDNTTTCSYVTCRSNGLDPYLSFTHSHVSAIFVRLVHCGGRATHIQGRVRRRCRDGLQVYRLNGGVENLASQDPWYRDRVRLLADELSDGWAKIQVSRLKISDAGTYQCLVQRGGADYKTITLSVKAPYKTVTKHIQKSAEGDEVLLTCQSEGFPQSSVEWQDKNLQRLDSNTTAVPTPDQLFKVTSQIQVSSSDKSNYTCRFTNDGYLATFHIPDEIPITHVRNDALIIALSIAVVLAVLVVAVLSYQRRKGVRCNTPGNKSLLVDNQTNPAAVSGLAAGTKSEEEEIIIINEGVGREETLGEFLKVHYSMFFVSTEARHRLCAFCVEVLPHRLQDNEGQPVSLQTLFPEAGETLLLEGPPESGKTTVAQILVSSWVDGPTHALSNFLDPSGLQLLFYVDCTKVKRELSQEIMTQLCLKEKVSTEDELRTVLSRSSEALLLLDGYREGNQDFDESLKRFLREKGGCRVLVMACPGLCPEFKGTVGTEGLLKLQI